MTTSDDNEKLNFLSPQFDASVALTEASCTARLPCPNAKTFNNIDEYFNKTFKKQPDDKSQITHDDNGVPVRKFTQEQIASVVKPKVEWKDPGNVLTLMKCQNGPMSVLQQCVGKRIRVLLRRRKLGDSGNHFAWLSALLIAYDKHMNLVIYDVDEIIGLHRKMTNDSALAKHSKKLFVRGDNIIIISNS